MRTPRLRARRPVTRLRTAALCWLLALLGAVPGVGRADDDARPSTAPVYIDVRTPEEFAAGHIQGARLLPYPTIEKTIGLSVPDKETPLVLYCAVGGRSGIALKKLKKMGYRNAVNGGGYFDYSVGVTKSIGNFALTLKWVDGSDLASSDGTPGDVFTSESKVWFSLATTLPWK